MNWPVTIHPPRLYISAGNSPSFNVSVTVPPDTSYYIQDTLTVYGYYHDTPNGNNYDIQQITGSIRIAQFYDIVIECEDPFKTAEPQEVVTFELNVWNYGNGRDTTVFYIPNLKELVNNDWKVNMEFYTIAVDEKSRKSNHVTVNTPFGSTSEITEILIEIQPEGCSLMDDIKQYPLYIRIKPYFPVQTPLLIIITAEGAICLAIFSISIFQKLKSSIPQKKIENRSIKDLKKEKKINSEII
jgi:hypothetical protein